MSQGMPSFCSAGGQGSELNNNLLSSLYSFIDELLVNTDLGTILLVIIIILTIVLILIIPPVRHRISSET